MKKAEKAHMIIWIISMIVFGISLACPTYCTNVRCSSMFSGFFDLILGWFGALFLGSTYSVWFANPVFFVSMFRIEHWLALGPLLPREIDI